MTLETGSSGPSATPSGEAVALRCFTEWLEREGADADTARFEALCGANPRLADDLRRLKRTWETIAEALLGAKPPLSSRDPLAVEASGSADPGISLDEPSDSTDSGTATPNAPRMPATAWSRLVERLGGRTHPNARYSVKGVVGEGGMGVVYSIWDSDLRRRLAMKVIRAAADSREPPPRFNTAPDASAASRAPIESTRVARFLEEAQITSQLSHPGIVPVHEIGLDADGRAFFTMRLVDGTTFDQVIDWAWERKNHFDQTRALGVLIAVCDALAHAHSKGVVHRDLKPSNVMVGRFGETYVMDWGLARVLGRADSHRERIDGADEGDNDNNVSAIDPSKDRTHSPTIEGTVVGTPAYMPPEQAFGRIEQIDARSDVYSTGALLYQLLTRRIPYVEPGSRPRSPELRAAVRSGPPPRVHELNPDVPAELAAICERAMERNPEKRYPTTVAFADDLRAYLDHRVVAAYRVGAVAELRKWVERNKSLGAALLAALVLLIGGVSWNAWVSRRHANAMEKKNRDLASATNEATASAALAKQEAKNAEDRLAEVLRLSDLKRVRDLRQRATQLWPAWTELVPEIEQWITDAKEVTSRLDLHRKSLVKMSERVLPADGAAADAATDAATFTAQRRKSEQRQRRSDLERLATALAERIEALTEAAATASGNANARTALETEIAASTARRTAIATELRGAATSGVDSSDRLWRFAKDDADSPWWHEQLTELIAALEALEHPIAVPTEVLVAWKHSADEETAPAAYAPTDATIAAMQRRIDHATWVEQVSLDEAMDAWREANSRIAQNPKYADFADRPFREQFGLVPIGPDPDSGLEEFWHVETGARPQRDPTNGKLVVSDATGVVVILLPGGTFTMGSMRPQAPAHPIGAPNVDPQSRPEEAPPNKVILEPFFISKFEMTQAQWMRVAGTNPSNFRESGGAAKPYPQTSPVEQVTWTEARDLTMHIGLRLPTEAQWEYAARAATTSVWWCGADAVDIDRRKAGNIFDQQAKRVGYQGTFEASWNDGFDDVAPVGSFVANPFGLHDVIGNVWEWCEDEHASDYNASPTRLGDGLRSWAAESGITFRVCRGGSWHNGIAFSRHSIRNPQAPTFQNYDLGLRPARVINW